MAKKATKSQQADMQSSSSVMKVVASWVIVIILLAGFVALATQVHYATSVLKAVILTVYFLFLLAAFLWLTPTGISLKQRFTDAIEELHRITWPSRQETGQFTLYILVIVVIASVLLWGIDSVLMLLINLIT